MRWGRRSPAWLGSWEGGQAEYSAAIRGGGARGDAQRGDVTCFPSTQDLCRNCDYCRSSDFVLDILEIWTPGIAERGSYIDTLLWNTKDANISCGGELGTCMQAKRVAHMSACDSSSSPEPTCGLHIHR